MKDILLILIPAIAGFFSCYLFRRQDYEAGRIAGANEERSWRNRIVIRAKYQARADGIIYGCENHEALMSRRAGNVSGRPISNTFSLCASPAMACDNTGMAATAQEGTARNPVENP